MKIKNENIKAEDYKEEYISEYPFDHIVIDNFLEKDLANSIADYLEIVELFNWNTNPSAEQVNKWWMSDLKKVHPAVAVALSWFNNKEALSFFEELTGIGGLIPDSEYYGGGVHVTTTGGSLDIHADFNYHPISGAHRRLNALLFLNRNWDSSWGGQLELWDKEIKEPIQIIEPIFNRLVLFNVSDNHFHGFPDPIKCPEDRRRLSLALYYYTKDRPEKEKNPFHWVLWKDTKK